MKIRVPFFILALLLSFGTVSAQGYYFIGEQGTDAPYFYDEPGDDLITSGNDVLSSWQQLPFTWNFFGLPVTGYYASDNGYITFDQGATASVASNVAIPSGSAPTNAIFAFWDDLQLGSGVVRSWTIGLPPNQTHCVQWFNVSPSAGGTITTTLRIYEGGAFDVVEDIGSGAQFTTSATVGAQDAFGSDAVMIPSGPNTQFPDKTADNVDDLIYVFIEGQQATWDLSVESLNLSQTLAAGTHQLSGNIRNYGSNSVSNLKIKYQIDGGAVQEYTKTTLVLTGNGGGDFFTHSVDIDLPNTGQFYQLKVWCDEFNGANADQNNGNDTLTIDLITILGNTRPKSFLMEKVTGTWCGYCPAGKIGFDEVFTTYPGQAVGVSVHTGDVMDAGTDYPAFYKVSGVPTSYLDRRGGSFNSDPKVYPTSLPSEVSSRLNETASVGIEVYTEFDAQTRTVTGTIVARFVDYALGDLRMVVLVTEDGIIEPQANFFSGEAGHPYGNDPSPIPNFEHNQVLRAVPLGEFGTSGIIPSLVSPNETYTENFTFTVPAGWNENNLHMVGIVMDYDDNFRKQKVLNASENSFDNGVSAAPAVEQTQIVDVFPNPVAGIGVARVDFSTKTKATFSLYNTFGVKVQEITSANYLPGTHHIYFDTQSLANGVYLFHGETSNGSLTRRVVVSH